MASIAPNKTEPAFVRLEWESQHFGLSAARLNQPDLTDAALASQLLAARRSGVQLAVWPAAPGRELPSDLLNEFGGMLVDRKATYTRPLQWPIDDALLPRTTDPPVICYTAPTATPALVELAIASGEYSRFRVDPRISQDRFEAMYRIWIERSVAGELADVVLVVPADDSQNDRNERAVGLITVSETGGVASIGLVAVAASVQGRGIGSALMRAAHRWMRERGAQEASVVTQQTNLPACRLYERSGYQLARVQPFYHFWL